MNNSNSSYALTIPTSSSSLLYRLWYKAQILKYSGKYEEANKIFNLVFKEIIKDPEIPHEVFWEMGNLYKGDPSPEEMNGILRWVITMTRAEAFGPNKSIISVNVRTDNRICYFCIPLPLLDKKTALYALEKATPVAPVAHKRNENSLAAQIQAKLTIQPINMIFGDAEMLVC